MGSPLQAAARAVRRLWEPGSWTAAPGPEDPNVLRPDLAADPLSRAYAAGDGPDAVLLCHGFTSTPQSMRPWADHLVAAGFAVEVPLLPGHATSWQELNRTPWTAWYAEVEAALLRLAARHERIYLAGLSMGGCLALRLAERFSTRISATVLVNPCVNITDPRIRVLPLLRLVCPSLPAIAGDIAKPGVVELGYERNPLHALYAQTAMWADVRRHLDRVDRPLLIYRSATDHVVDPSSVGIIARGVRAETTVITLTRSYHVATLDHEAELIFAGSVDFFRQAGRRE